MNPLLMKLVGVGLLAAAMVSGYFYIKYLQSSLELEKANNVTLQETVKSAKEAISNLQADVKAVQSGVTKMNDELAKSRADVKSLDKKFTESKNGEKRNLENLAAKHPELIEKAINKGTKEAMRCNELVTGAKPEPNEKNSVCPSLLK